MRRFRIVRQAPARMPHEVVEVHRPVRARGSHQHSKADGGHQPAAAIQPMEWVVDMLEEGGRNSCAEGQEHRSSLDEQLEALAKSQDIVLRHTWSRHALQVRQVVAHPGATSKQTFDWAIRGPVGAKLHIATIAVRMIAFKLAHDVCQNRQALRCVFGGKKPGSRQTLCQRPSACLPLMQRALPRLFRGMQLA